MIHIVIKSTPRFTRFLSLVLIRLVFTEIQPFENVKIYKEMYGNPDAVRHGVQIAIHFFVNFDQAIIDPFQVIKCPQPRETFQ